MSVASSELRGAVGPKKAAELLDTTEGTLSKWRRQHVGPPYLKVGTKVLYRLESLESYLRDLEAEQMKAV